VLDGITTDDDATRAIAGVLETRCGLTPDVVRLSDLEINDGDGLLTVGHGNTVIVAGGPFFQGVTRNLDDQGATSVFVETVGDSTRFVRRSDDVNLVSEPTANLNNTHDFFYIEVLAEPQRGALVVVAYGFFGPGTQAAQFYFVNELADQINAQLQVDAGPDAGVDGGVDAGVAPAPSLVRVIEWSDDDLVAGPSEGDVFSVVFEQ
jgi:hypothetical protein